MQTHPKRWKIDEAQRLVAFLQKKVGGTGKGIRRILEANGCRVNGRVERFGSSWVKAGDVVEFSPNEKGENRFEVLFETADLKVVNKPAGWICQDAHCRKMFGSSVFLVHRLDKDTTGVLLLAKSLEVCNSLKKLFADRVVEKEYMALVDGTPREIRGVQESYLAKRGSFHGQTVWGSSSRGGNQAVTRWEVLATADKASLILCQPLTGRTHQIRVHMAEMSHPILVDRQYADQFRSSLFAPRPLLHAKRLRLIFQGESVDVTARLPDDFLAALSVAKINHKC